jgi:curved DNA-binding protein CbpA
LKKHLKNLYKITATGIMGATSSRQYTYQQYYSAIKKSGELETLDLKGIDMKTIDPYEVLNVSKQFTWIELKESYRKLAMNTHPDKEGGNKELFNIITYCFKKLAVEYKKREQDLPHHELKKQSSEYFNKITNDEIPHPSESLRVRGKDRYGNGGNGNGGNGGNSDGQGGSRGDTDNYGDDGGNGSEDELFSTKFNRNFEKCKVYDDEMDFGYGQKMDVSSKVREDINIEKLIKKNKIDNKSFNDIFNKSVPVNKQLVKYREPEPMLMAKNLHFTELGAKKPDDYSSSVEKNNNLAYTDYMKAHDGTRLIDPSIINGKKEFKSVEEFQMYRDTKANKVLSKKELREQEKKRLNDEKSEAMRVERLGVYDKRIETSYEKANKLFLR